jgi:hypothetical protein
MELVQQTEEYNLPCELVVTGPQMRPLPRWADQMGLRHFWRHVHLSEDYLRSLPDIDDRVPRRNPFDHILKRLISDFQIIASLEQTANFRCEVAWRIAPI